MHNRIWAMLLACLLVAAFAVNASAEDMPVDMPDLTGKGSLELTMEVEGVPLNSGSLNLYYVASLTEVEWKEYDFQLVDALANAGAQLDTADLYNDEQAEKLLEEAKRVLPDDYRTAAVSEGKVYFENLDAGLYLVWQAKKDACDGYDAIRPFLISVPRLQDGEYTMDVKASPKVPFEIRPTEPPPPTPPPPPNLPKTGQLNWPVPVMAISGAMLLVLGWCLCLRGNRRENEE